MKKKEAMELIGSVIAPIVAAGAAAFTFWWLTMYSVLCAEKKGEEE